MSDIGMIIGKLAGLLCDGSGNLWAPVTYVNAVETCESIEQPVSIPVLYVAAGPAGDHAIGQISPRKFRQMRRRVKEIFAIPRVELVVFKHGLPRAIGGAPPVTDSEGAFCAHNLKPVAFG